MNRVELLDHLFAARRELTRIIVATARADVAPDMLQTLMTQRDQLNVQIQTIIVSDLKASMSDLDKACVDIDAAVANLQHVTDVAKGIETAVDVAKRIVNIVGSVLTIV